ncbi:sialic acid-binding Ig-like lectin 13 [Paramisgurnus dabryanus]|uniref:sialic acid-binding Ig-like lectin 13 n=1 Tax=Paramisgurnus dabryanus TaxID=90735 RepID=UPI003CCF9317
MDKLILLIFLLQGVWCGDWSVSLPEKIEALSGSCVTINCTFDIYNKYDNDLTDSAAGVWFKDGIDFLKNVVFNSSRTNLYVKGEIIGKLKSKDCTTIFYNVTSNYSGQFFFRIEGNGGLKITFSKKSALINVIDSPPNPTVQMFKDQMEVEVHEEVLEGSSMCLGCSAKTLCSSSPPTLTWSSTDRLHLNESSRLQLDQQKQTEIISDLNFTATHLQHGVTFICTITYQIQQRNTTAQNNITLRVQYPPKNTLVSVFPSNSVLEGSSVTLICSSDGNPAVFNYTWYRENGGQLEELQTGYNLTFNVTDRTHTGRYYCQTKNQHGTQNTSVLLDIQYAAKISLFSCNRTDITVCLCEAHGNPSPKVEWHLSGRPVSNSTNTFISEERLSSTDLRSFITLHQSLTHTDTLQCVINNTHSTASKQIQLVASPQEMTRHSAPVSLAPSAASSPAPSSCSSACYPATVSMSSLNSLPFPTSPGSPHPASLLAPWNSAPAQSVSLVTPAAALSQFVLPGTVSCVSTPKPALKTPKKATRSPRPQPSPKPPGPSTPAPPSPNPSGPLLCSPEERLEATP